VAGDEDRCPTCGGDVSLAMVEPDDGGRGWSSERDLRRSRRRVQPWTAVAAVAVLAVAWGSFAMGGARSPVRDPSAPQAVVSALAEPGLAPRGAGGVFLCPSDVPFAAYASGFYFPPNHPDHPAAIVRPARCYSTAGAAEAAHSVLAPVMPPDRETGMVYLGPPGAAAIEGCARAARTLGFAVPCPTLVPLPRSGVEAFGCEPSIGVARDCLLHDAFSRLPLAFVFEAPAFAVPPGWGTEMPDLLVVARPIEGSEASDRNGVFACRPLSGSSSASVALAATVHDRRAVFVRCDTDDPSATSLYGGRTVLQWRQGGLLCEVSIGGGGDPDLVRALDWWIATQTVWVGPEGRIAP
jgi:hypothetical protein